MIRIDMRGVEAVRFKASIGGDYPLGDENQRRKTYAIRTPEKTVARFLTIIEPYESKAVIKSATAVSADKFRVELIDGRTQEITLQNFEGTGPNISAQLEESKAGKPLRSESTISAK